MNYQSILILRKQIDELKGSVEEQVALPFFKTKRNDKMSKIASFEDFKSRKIEDKDDLKMKDLAAKVYNNIRNAVIDLHELNKILDLKGIKKIDKMRFNAVNMQTGESIKGILMLPDAEKDDILD